MSGSLMAIPPAPCVCGLSLRGLRLLSDPRGKQSHAVSVCHEIKNIPRSNVTHAATHPPLASFPRQRQFTSVSG